MLYRSNTDRVLCPVIFIATASDTPEASLKLNGKTTAIGLAIGLREDSSKEKKPVND